MTWRLCTLVVCVSLAAPGGPAQVNLARQARIEASASAEGHRAAEAADGRLDTFWTPGENAAGGAWLEFSWPAPIVVREVVIRQIPGAGNRSTLEAVSVEAFRNGGWERVASLGGSAPVPVYALAEFAPQTISRLRVSNMRGTVRVREVEIYEGPNPPYLDVRGDAAGNVVGEFADAWGTAGYGGAAVTLSGSTHGRAWTAGTTTSPSGEFTVPMPAGLTGTVHIVARVGSRGGEKIVDAGDLHQGLVPRPAGGGAIPLTGKWRFCTDPPEGFEKPGFPDSGWTEMDVPSHWIMRGFHSESGIGGYRKVVPAPETWRGRRVRIAFDGVYSGAEVWVNGRRAGSHLGGANPFQLDVTDLVRPGRPNLIAVRVREHTDASDQLDHMSQYADFPLGGIMRKAYLFTVPPLHVVRLHAVPRLDADLRDAVLAVDVTLVNESDRAESAVRADLALMDATGAAVATASLTPLAFSGWDKVQRRIEIPVPRPRHWEAEHPNLYTLRTVLTVRGQTIETVEQRTGFRDVRVRGTEFLVNGVPVKLKGTCHHDSHPLMGRAVTPELERRDIELIKDANLNALRTSHYPPLPELLDLADEKGVYVEDEASFCWVDNSFDLRLSALARQFTSELVERDRDHPSVVIWSSGNESLWGPILLSAESLVRERDTTRPVIGSWLRDHFDMLVHHNPMDIPLLREYANAKKPINWDESLGIFQGIWGDGKEIWRDPGYRDYYVEPLKPIWEEFWKSKVAQGSFIWAWSDDLFAVPGRSSEFGRDTTPWHSQSVAYGMPGRGIAGDAPWGVVDGWRRTKPEFWHIKKLHSPVRVWTTELEPEPGMPLRIEVENRYHFTPFSELAIEWKLDGRKGTVRSSLAPLASGVLEIRPGFDPAPGSELVLRFTDNAGRVVETSAVRIGRKAVPALPSGSPLRTYEENSLAGSMLRVAGDGFEIGFSRGSGVIRRAVVGGRAVLQSGPALHILPADPAASDFPAQEAWKLTGFEVERLGTWVVVTARGEYPNLAGSYRTTIEPSGRLELTYDFTYTGPETLAREIGVTLGLPLTEDSLAWERNGEWSWYPDDHIGRNRGTARAHAAHLPGVPPSWPWAQDDSPLGTNDFRSQKRRFTSATLTDSQGYGLALASDGSQHLRAALASDRVEVHVNDWFGGAHSRDEWRHFGEGKKIAHGERLQGTVRFRMSAGRPQ